MTLTLKSGVSVVVVSCAVAIPLSINSGVNSNQKVSSLMDDLTPDNSNKGQLIVSKCESYSPGGRKIVNFGDDTTKDVCWLAEEADERLSQEVGDIKKYTELFMEKWENFKVSWSDASQGQDGWKTVCYSSWVMSVEGEGREILGLCANSKLDPDKFIEKNRDSEGNITLKICKGQCFRDVTITGSFKKFENTQGDWKEVKFYGKKA